MFGRRSALTALCAAGYITAGLAGTALPQPGATVQPPAPSPIHPWVAACAGSDDWDRPAPPFRVFGNTWYVGTCGITVLLVAGPSGLTLIDSGTDKGADVVLANIRALGFDPRKVTTLLMSHEHFDHVGGMAKLQAATRAIIVATPEAARVLRSGKPGPDDPQALSGHPPFPPVTGRIVKLRGERAQMAGSVAFQPMFTPGHTPGAVSWTWSSCEGTVCKQIVYADSLNPISADSYRFSDHPALLVRFRAGLATISAAPCDILLAPHPAAAQMREHLTGSVLASGPGGLPCQTYARAKAAALQTRLTKEAPGAR